MKFIFILIIGWMVLGFNWSIALLLRLNQTVFMSGTGSKCGMYKCIVRLAFEFCIINKSLR